MKTVLITGCSSGFGLETAKYFLDRGWKVIATMRTPAADVLPSSEHLRVLPLDVTDANSILALVASVTQIDALVNNAGVGMIGVLEMTSMDAVRRVFDANTFGTIAMCRAFLPQLRAEGGGVIVNVTSSTTLVPHPMLSVYTGSKAAVEAFTRSLALELEQVGVRARLVIPGRSPQTRFRANAQRVEGMPHAYAVFAQTVVSRMATESPAITHSSDVAEAVWRAVTDPLSPIDIPAGADAIALAASRSGIRAQAMAG